MALQKGRAEKAISIRFNKYSHEMLRFGHTASDGASSLQAEVLPSLALHPLPVTSHMHPHSERGLVFADPGRQLSSPRAVLAGLSSTSSPHSAECLLPCPSAHSSLCPFVSLSTDTWGLFFPPPFPRQQKAGSPEDHYILLCV